MPCFSVPVIEKNISDGTDDNWGPVWRQGQPDNVRPQWKVGKPVECLRSAVDIADRSFQGKVQTLMRGVDRSELVTGIRGEIVRRNPGEELPHVQVPLVPE